VTIGYNPRSVKILGNRGLALAAMGRVPEALASYTAATAISDDADVHINMGNTLSATRRPEAHAAYRYTALFTR
jgi:hypothetical protein